MEIIKAGLPEEIMFEFEERMRKNREFREAEAKYEEMLDKIEKLDPNIKNELDSAAGFIMLYVHQYSFETGIKEGIKFIIQCLLDT